MNVTHLLAYPRAASKSNKPVFRVHGRCQRGVGTGLLLWCPGNTPLKTRQLRIFQNECSDLQFSQHQAGPWVQSVLHADFWLENQVFQDIWGPEWSVGQCSC